MEFLDISEIISYAVIFQQQIRRMQEEKLTNKWTWEAYLPGPICQEDAELIMAIAGCWCTNISEENVMFYTNQNHPSWSPTRQPMF